MEPRVCGYIRMSSKDQSQSLVIQREEILIYCKNRGWPEPFIYSDTLSGTLENRPELDQMMFDLRQYKWTHLITYRSDRLFRSMSGLVNTVNELSRLKVCYISIKDGLDLSDGPMQKAMLYILGIFAEMEISLLKSRISSGILKAQERGVVFGRPRKASDEKILQLYREGKAQSQIALELKCSRSTISRSLKRSVQKHPKAERK